MTKPVLLSAGTNLDGFRANDVFSATAKGTFTYKYNWKNADGSAATVPPPKYPNLRVASIARFDSAVDISPTSQYNATGNGYDDNGLGTPEVDSSTVLAGISDNLIS